MRARRGVLVLASAAMVAIVLSPRHAEGTVEEQRARLPPAADCEDLVEGTWRGLEFLPLRGLWLENTIDLRRVTPGGGELTGEIHVRYWRGGEGDARPPRCVAGGVDIQVKEPNALGAIQGVALTFGATTYVLEETYCGTSSSYNPDHYSGTVEASRDEFQSVNNDGRAAVDEPVVFRRIRCVDGGLESREAPAPHVAPPAYEPPKRGVSCGRL